jgi:hypothetical protein
MWKESIVMGILGLLHHDRRKHGIDVPNDRRQGSGNLTVKQATKTLHDSLDNFSKTVTFQLPKKK